MKNWKNPQKSPHLSIRLGSLKCPKKGEGGKNPQKVHDYRVGFSPLRLLRTFTIAGQITVLKVFIKILQFFFNMVLKKSIKSPWSLKIQLHVPLNPWSRVSWWLSCFLENLSILFTMIGSSITKNVCPLQTHPVYLRYFKFMNAHTFLDQVTMHADY